MKLYYKDELKQHRSNLEVNQQISKLPFVYGDILNLEQIAPYSDNEYQPRQNFLLERLQDLSIENQDQDIQEAHK